MERRRVEEPGRHADRAGVERLLQPLAHRRDLVGARRPVEVGHRADPQGRMADETGGVDRRRRPIERRQIIGEARIGVVAGVADQVERRRRASRRASAARG